MQAPDSITPEPGPVPLEEAPTATGVATRPFSPLDEAIFRFWREFVTRQMTAGRRDVGRMLEVALGFFFDRSLQGSKNDSDKRNAVESMIRELMLDATKADAVLASVAEGVGADTPLAQPFAGRHIAWREDDPNGPVIIRPLAPLLRLDYLRAYRATLEKQTDAAQRLSLILTNKLLTNRRLVAQRLKDLSPLLYQQGVAMAAALDIAAAVPPPLPEPPPQPVVAVSESGLREQLTQGAAAGMKALKIGLLGCWWLLQHLWATLHRRWQTPLDEVASHEPKDSLEAAIAFSAENHRFREYAELAARWMRKP